MTQAQREVKQKLS